MTPLCLRLRWASVGALALIAALPLSAAAPPSPRVVNVTLGSERGWIPSESLEARALGRLRSFESEIDAGEFASAYAMFGDGLKRQLPLAQFQQQQDRFRALAGSRTGKRILAINWTKGSPDQPMPGIYVAIDVSYHYQRAQRHCGFVILHATDENAPFTVQRTENAYIDDASAARIIKDESPEKVERLWREMTAYCPNYQPA